MDRMTRMGLLALFFACFFAVSAQAQTDEDVTITVDSTYSGYDTSVINDGEVDAHGGTSTTWASAESSTEPHWVELEFAEAKKIGSVTIHWAYNDYRDQYMTSERVEVQAWDGSSYRTVAALTHMSVRDKERSAVTFDPTVTTKLRLYQPAGGGPDSYDKVMWLTEVDYGLAPVAVDSTYPGYGTDVITDGEIDPIGGTNTTWASAESTTEPHWVDLRLDQPRTLDSATIHWAYNHKREQYMSSQQVEVQFLEAGQWRTAATVNPGVDEESTAIEFDFSVFTSRLRFYQPAGMGPSAYSGVMWLTEIDVGTGPRTSVNSTYPGYDPAAIDDGVIDAYGGTSTTWASEERDTPHVIVMELAGEMVVDSVTIHWAWNHKRDAYMTSQNVDVQVWSGEHFNYAGTITPPGPEASTTFSFGPLTTNRLRFIQHSNEGPVNYDTVMWLTELDVGGMPLPEASFTTDPASGFEAGAAIGFTDTSTDPDGEVTWWQWDFGDGTVSIDQHPVHTYSEPGTYEVTLSVTDDEDIESLATTHVLHVGGTEVDSTYSGYNTSVIDDGVIDATGGTSTTWASSESSSDPHFVDLHFGEEKEVDYALIHWAFNDKRGEYMTSQEVQVQMWNGSSYQTIATAKRTSPEPDTTVVFDPVTTTRLRFYQPAGQGPASYDKVIWLTEIDYGLRP